MCKENLLPCVSSIIVVGASVGASVGSSVGASVGASVGVSVGGSVAATIVSSVEYVKYYPILRNGKL